MELKIGFFGSIAAAACVLASAALAVGPDVTHINTTSTTNYGVVGNIRAYALGSSTCNIGTTNLTWASQGTPGFAMNMYRLYDGKLEQVGMAFAKVACCAAAGSGCGIPCNGQGGSVLGVGCLDVYGSSYNGGQSRLAARSAINGWTGAFGPFSTASGDAIFKRLQVRQTDLQATGFPGALYFIEGVYVGTDDAQSGNRNNNASYKRVTVDQSTFNLTLQGSMYYQIPAIFAWRDHGLGVGITDPSVIIQTIDVPGEGRIFLGSKVSDIGGGMWRYQYAIYNLSSDRSVGSFSLPMTGAVSTANVGFTAPFYHSGEPYDNSPWPNVSDSPMAWETPQSFAQNPNSSAIRWGTMATFWFDASAPPSAGSGNIGLFKPHTTQNISVNIDVPTNPSQPDVDGDGVVGGKDLGEVLAMWTLIPGTPACGASVCPADVNHDGTVDGLDIGIILAHWG
jgi:hypothetical protein